MNETTIEKILRQAPRPAPASNLLARLQSGITLSERTRVNKDATNGRINPPRRWMPALAFALFLFSCMVLIGVQAHWIGQLKQENARLRIATADLDQLQRQQKDNAARRAQLEELAELRTENADLERLRAEVKHLTDLARQTGAAPAAIATTASSAADNSVFEEAERNETRIGCVNNLKQIGLAYRLWAGDHGDRYPTSVLDMTNELNTPTLLVCPAEKAKRDQLRQDFASQGWAAFQPDMMTYELRFSGEKDDVYPECVVGKCPIHHNYLMADGSVQSIDPAKWKETTIDGRTYLKPVEDTNSSP